MDAFGTAGSTQQAVLGRAQFSRNYGIGLDQLQGIGGVLMARRFNTASPRMTYDKDGKPILTTCNPLTSHQWSKETGTPPKDSDPCDCGKLNRERMRGCSQPLTTPSGDQGPFVWTKSRDDKKL
jgi:hypothetical protein